MTEEYYNDPDATEGEIDDEGCPCLACAIRDAYEHNAEMNASLAARRASKLLADALCAVVPPGVEGETVCVFHFSVTLNVDHIRDFFEGPSRMLDSVADEILGGAPSDVGVT